MKLVSRMLQTQQWINNLKKKNRTTKGNRGETSQGLFDG